MGGGRKEKGSNSRGRGEVWGERTGGDTRISVDGSELTEED